MSPHLPLDCLQQPYNSDFFRVCGSRSILFIWNWQIQPLAYISVFLALTSYDVSKSCWRCVKKYQIYKNIWRRVWKLSISTRECLWHLAPVHALTCRERLRMCDNGKHLVGGIKWFCWGSAGRKGQEIFQTKTGIAILSYQVHDEWLNIEEWGRVKPRHDICQKFYTNRFSG